MKRIVQFLFFFFIALVGVWFLFIGTRQPSNTRIWAADQATLPWVTLDDTLLTFHAVRDFFYTAEDQYEVRYTEKTVDITTLSSVDYLVVPFGEWDGPAHTLLSFEFTTDDGDTEYIVISVEIRKEADESFSVFKGLFRNYEIMYVVGTEQDLIGLRTNYRNNEAYLYPIDASPEKKQAVLRSMIDRINALHKKPEFYNTLTNNCTSNIRDHVNTISPGRIPFTKTTILPAFSDKFIYDLGLIDTALPFEEAKKHFYITDLAQSVTDWSAYSDLIRSGR